MYSLYLYFDINKNKKQNVLRLNLKECKCDKKFPQKNQLREMVEQLFK